MGPVAWRTRFRIFPLVLFGRISQKRFSSKLRPATSGRAEFAPGPGLLERLPAMLAWDRAIHPAEPLCHGFIGMRSECVATRSVAGPGDDAGVTAD
jgi:hypothetical protein